MGFLGVLWFVLWFLVYFSMLLCKSQDPSDDLDGKDAATKSLGD